MTTMTKSALFVLLVVLAFACTLLFAATTMTNGGMVYKTFATHPDVPPSGGLLMWAKTDGTMQLTNSSAVDSGMGGGGGPSLFRPPVAVDNTTGWTDYGSTTGRTVDTSNVGIVIISTAGAGAGTPNVQGRKMSVTAPFDKIFAIMPLLGSDAIITPDYASAGVFVADAAGKCITCALENYGAVGGLFFQYFKRDSPSSTILLAPTPSATVGAVNPPFNDLTTPRMFPLRGGISTVSYFRLKDASSTLSCQWSPDGYSWLTVWSAADTAFLSAPTAVGYFVDSGNQAFAAPLYMIVRGVE